MGGRKGIILLVIKWLKSFPSLIILLTGYTFLQHFTVYLSQLLFLPSAVTPLPKDFLIHKDELNLILILFMSL